MSQNQTESKPQDVEEPREEGLDETTCSQCVEWRTLADDALNTLRITREKYGIGDRHVMREKNREIEKLRVALKDATELLGEIMRDEVNHQDEAEKWLRAYGEIGPANAEAIRSADESTPTK